MAPVADIVVNAPLPAVVPPILPGDAKVAPPRVAALIELLHESPLPFVYKRAFVAPEQEGTENAAGAADPPVKFPSTVLADCADKLEGEIVPEGNMAVPVTVNVGTIRGPVRVPPEIGKAPKAAAAPLAVEDPVPPREIGMGEVYPVAAFNSAAVSCVNGVN